MADPGSSPGETEARVSVIERNVAALIERRQAEEKALGWQDRLAGAISGFAGSMTFVWLHVAIYGGWIAVNLGTVPGLPAWDPSFVMLAMIASVEAIFLSTFILITQNRMQALADRRAELNLQISLLAEHELTRVMRMVSDIAERVGAGPNHAELEELRRDVRPEQVLESIERQDRQNRNDRQAG